MLRDGPALAIPDRDGETSLATRLLRSWTMVAFEINVAGVIPGAVTPWRQPGAPAFLARSRGNPRPAPGGADMHAMRTLRASGATPR